MPVSSNLMILNIIYSKNKIIALLYGGLKSLSYGGTQFSRKNYKNLHTKALEFISNPFLTVISVIGHAIGESYNDFIRF